MPTWDLAPFALSSVHTVYQPEKRKYKVVFIVSGDVTDMRVRRIRFRSRQVYIERDEWRRNYLDVRNIIAEAKAKVYRRRQELIEGGAITQ